MNHNMFNLETIVENEHSPQDPSFHFDPTFTQPFVDCQPIKHPFSNTSVPLTFQSSISPTNEQSHLSNNFEQKLNLSQQSPITNGTSNENHQTPQSPSRDILQNITPQSPISPTGPPKLSLRQLSEQRKQAQKDLELKLKKQTAEQQVLKEQLLEQQQLLREQQFNEQQAIIQKKREDEEQERLLKEKERQRQVLEDKQKELFLKEQNQQKLLNDTPKVQPPNELFIPQNHQNDTHQQTVHEKSTVEMTKTNDSLINSVPQEPLQVDESIESMLESSTQIRKENDQMKVKAPETAQRMKALFESGKVKGSSEYNKTTAEEEIASQMLLSGAGIYENEPTRLEGVVRADEILSPEEEIRGIDGTKKKKDEWMSRANNQFNINRAPINIAEDEGKVAESQPTQRSDVLREDDGYEDGSMVSNKGMTQNLKKLWSNMKGNYVKQNKEIKLVEKEDEKSVSENTPLVRSDVHREDDEVLSPEEEIARLRSGNTTQIREYWSTQNDSKGSSRNSATPAMENNYIPPSGEDISRYECDLIEKGTTKVMANKWQHLDTSWRNRKLFNLEGDLASGKEAGVFENKPTESTDEITKSGALYDEVMARQGLTKMMSKKFLDQDFWNPKSPKSPPVMDLAEGPGVHENNPHTLRDDITRHGDESYEHLHLIRQQGLASNLRNKWVTLDVEGADFSKNPKFSGSVVDDERAKEAGVFENTPEVRNDVYREQDYEDEMVSVAKTRNLRALWGRMESEENNAEKSKKSRAPQQIRFTPPREKSP